MIEISDGLQRRIDAGDFTVADLVRHMRPGGPLDSTGLATACVYCGDKKRESLRWFIDSDFQCECGGEYEYSALQRLEQAARRGDRAAIAAIAEIFHIPTELAP